MRYQVGDEPVPGYKYKLEAFLGEGSYGEVWRALGPGGVPCALKFIRIDSKSGLKELKAIGLIKQLRHPNLVPVQAIWLKDPEGNLIGDTQNESVRFQLKANKELIIAMGLGEKALTDRLNECRAKKGMADALPNGMPLRELIRCMDDAARGIDYLNEPVHDFGNGPASIIHCDIKPGNLLIVGGGVQVCDYGVARALALDAASMAKKTLAAGTPAYAPAELINNEPSPATDQYSLAITYYELRTGRLPFEESRALVCNLTGALDLNLLPPGERDVIRQATMMRPEDRFETCSEMVEALRSAAAITMSKPSVRVGPPAHRVSSGVVPMLQPQAPEAQEAKPTGRSPAVGPKAGDLIVPVLRLKRPLGSGRSGNLWEAQGPGGDSVAVKIIRGVHDITLDLTVLDRLRKLAHTHLVPFQRAWLLTGDGSEIPADRVGRGNGPIPAAVVIATNYVERTLQNRFRECEQRGSQGIPKEELVGYMRQAASVLDYLNLENNVQHRDVSPNTLMLRGDQVLLSTFGLARLTDGPNGESPIDLPGQWTEYSAPEVLANRVSARADEYSLAVTYYTLRTGALPFPPARDTVTAIRARNDGRYDLAGVSPAEEDVLTVALNPNPAARFGSCVTFVRQLSIAVGVGSTDGHVPLPATDSSTVRDSDRRRSDTLPPPRQDPQSGHTARAVETPRSTPYPPDSGDIPLYPASPPASHGTDRPGHAGTINFTGAGSGRLDVPVYQPEPPATPATSSWREHPVESRRSSTMPARNTQQYDPDGGSSSKGGTLAALAAGFVGLLIVGGGIAFVVKNQPPGNASNTSPTKSDDIKPPPPDIKGMEDAIRGHVIFKEVDKAQAKIDELSKLDHDRGQKMSRLLANATLARTHMGANRRDEAIKVIEVVVKDDEPLAVALRNELPDPVHVIGNPMPDDPNHEKRNAALAAARTSFQNAQFDAAMTKLNDAAKLSPPAEQDKLIKARYEAAKQAKDAKSYTVASFPDLEKYLQQFGKLATAVALTDPADKKDLEDFAAANLTDKILAMIPTLTPETNWSALASICAAAKQDPAIKSCLVECWAEMSAGGKSPLVNGAPLTPPSDAELVPQPGHPLDGYIAYAKARRMGAPSGAAAAAVAVPMDIKSPPTWFAPFRAERLAVLLLAAGKSRKTDKYEQPYPADAKDVVPWFAAADRASERAGTLFSKKAVDELRYERLLAVWSFDPGDAAVKLLANDLKASDAAAELKAPDAVRFWAIHGESRGPSASERADAADSYRSALRLADKLDKAHLPFVFTQIVSKLANQQFAGPVATADAPTRERVADALTDAGRFIRRHAAAIAGIQTAVGKPASAAQLFEAAYGLGNKADAAAWKGIARSEETAPRIEDLAQDLKDAETIDGTHPAVVVLRGVVARIKAFQALDAQEQLELLRSARSALTSGITAMEKDPTRWSDELSVAYETAAHCAILTATISRDKTEQDKQLTGAAKLADSLVKLVPDNPAAQDLLGCVLEHKAWLLKPATRLADGGEYDLADKAYQTAARGRTPTAHRGRNMVRWAEDIFTEDGVSLDTGKLGAAEQLLTEVAKNPAANPTVVTEAECWLGRSAYLRYRAVQVAAPKAGHYKKAIDHYLAAAKLTNTPGTGRFATRLYEDLMLAYQTEASRLIPSNNTKKNQQLPANDIKAARNVAASLIALADGQTGLQPSKVGVAEAKVEAALLGKKLGDKPADVLAAIQDAVTSAQGKVLSQDREQQLKLLLLLASATCSQNEYKTEERSSAENAQAYSAAAESLAPATKDLESPWISPSTREEVLGTIGLFRFKAGLYAVFADKVKGIEKRDAEWADARDSLTRAIDLAKKVEKPRKFGDSLPQPKTWMWRDALSGIILADAMKQENTDPATAATEATRVVQLLRQSDTTVLSVWFRDPGVATDAGWHARNNWQERTNTLNGCNTLLAQGLKADDANPAAPLWRLARADIACALKDPDLAKGYARDSEERAELNSAMNALRSHIKNPQVPGAVRSAAEENLTRLDNFFAEINVK